MRPEDVVPQRRRVSTQSGTTGVATWTDAAWRSAALAWALARLGERGLTLTGRPEQPHIRAWSTAFRLPVRGGAVWLKSVGPGSAQEPPLVEALGTWVPEHVLVPLAVDPERRLMLLPDGGATLRAAGGAGSVEAWKAMLGDYARIQVELVPHAEEMVALGVPDSASRRRFPGGRRPGRRRGVPAGRRRRRAAEPTSGTSSVSAGSATGLRTAASPPRCSTTTCTTRTSSSATAGTASSTGATPPSPTPSQSARAAPGRGGRLGVPAGDPVLLRLRDAYLEPWSSASTPAELRLSGSRCRG